MSHFAPQEAAVSLAGLGRERSVRDWIAWAAQARFRAVSLDATAPGVRARDLSRSARRELASLLRRHELNFAGLDLWIPPEHFSSREHIDRAAAAVEGAIIFAGEIAALNDIRQPCVSLVFPETPATDTINHLAATASDAGVIIADHHWPPRSTQIAHESLRVGIDPAAILLATDDPAQALIANAGRLGCVRFTDAAESSRRTPGSGRLDLEDFRTALMASQWTGPIIIDVRALASPAEQAVTALHRWTCQP